MRTIFLQGQNEGQLNSLDWNAFEGWPDDVHAYEIFRAVNEDGSFMLAGGVNGNTTTFTDNISSVPGEYTMLRYMVRALQDADASTYSWSNEIFFEYTPQVFLPNAFRPGGKNPVFMPVAVNADFSEYRLDVYNRWGELVFSSYEFGQGWDGTIKGSDAPAGVYVCVLSYKSAGTETTTLKSTFVLIR
jgi:gliding motility-associated-like protein